MNDKLAIITDDDLKTLEQAGIIPKGTPAEQVAVFAKICKEKGLSPFTKQIYLLPFNVKSGEKWETRYATITGIDGYRAIAERTGKYAGNDDYRFDEGKTEFDCRHDGRKFPVTATATVHKLVNGDRVAHTATASWESYYPGEKKGFNWNRMPFFMLGKVAEALALRKAFPEALGNIYVEEERAPMETIQVKPEAQPIEQDQVNKSIGILEAVKKEVKETKTSVEIFNTSKIWIENATKEGLLPEHLKELKAFINTEFAERKKANTKAVSNET